MFQQERTTKKKSREILPLLYGVTRVKYRAHKNELTVIRLERETAHAKGRTLHVNVTRLAATSPV